jgi:nucleoside phosphorylase
VKILIVDDSPRRYAKLLASLTPTFVDRDDIDVRVCANDARDALRDKHYDLMIIDILLPLRADEDPSERHSQDLLIEITEFGDLCKPNLIVGLTADRELGRKVEPVFKERLWTVVIYSDDNDAWTQQIAKCVEWIVDKGRRASRPSYGVDLVVLCALAEPELRAVLRLPWEWSAARPLDELLFVHDGKFSYGGKDYTVAAASCSRMGMVSSALVASRLIEKLRPRVIAMTGICAAVRGKAQLGDVLLADPSWDWQSGKRARLEDKSSFAISPHQLDVDPGIRTRFEALKGDRSKLSAIADAWQGNVPGQLKLIVGPVASGSAVLADQGLVPEIQAQHREVCGIEMEAYGVYSAAAFAEAPKPLFFSMKAACDFADSSKNNDYQSYAAYTSAKVLELFIERYMSDFKMQTT